MMGYSQGSKQLVHRYHPKSNPRKKRLNIKTHSFNKYYLCGCDTFETKFIGPINSSKKGYSAEFLLVGNF